MKKLSSVCLITPDVPGLSDFYQRVLEVAPEGDDVFVSCSISGAKLSIFLAQAPTTQPWGIRSVWFLDPDGNKVKFYGWVGSDESGR